MSDKKKILIIEDEGSLRDALHQALTSEGFEAIKAENGQEGLEIALREHPDLILLDIILPKIDGLTIAKKLRGDAWGKNVPIIILTNLNEAALAADAIDQAIQNNIYDYLVKSDWQLPDVIKRIRERLRTA